MSDDTQYDRWIKWCKNQPVIAAVMLLAAAVAGGSVIFKALNPSSPVEVRPQSPVPADVKSLKLQIDGLQMEIWMANRDIEEYNSLAEEAKRRTAHARSKYKATGLDKDKIDANMEEQSQVNFETERDSATTKRTLAQDRIDVLRKRIAEAN